MIRLKKQLSVLFIVLCVLCVQVSSVFAEEGSTNGTVKVKLEAPIIIGQTKSTESSVATLNADAVKLGVGNMRLMGTSTFVKGENQPTRTDINWHTVKVESNNKAFTEGLPSSLTSRYATDAKRTDAGEMLNAHGDWDGVLDALKTIQERINNDVQKVKEIKKDPEDETKDSNLSMADGSSFAPIEAGDTSTKEGAYTTLNTDVKSARYEDCAPFVSEGDMKVYEQKIKIVVGDSGRVYDTSPCTNTGTTWPIQVKDGNCTYSYDFSEGKAYKMEQWYYIIDGDEKNVGECRKNEEKVYKLNEYFDICPDYFDEANAVVFPQSRWGIEVGNATIYANECQPVSNKQFPVVTEVVLDTNGYYKTEDDYTNNISYPLVNKYYYNNEGVKTYLVKDVRSTTESYPHKHDETNCNWVMEDAKLRGRKYSTTYIDTSNPDATKKRKELRGCEAYSAWVSYAYLGFVYPDGEKGVLLALNPNALTPVGYSPPSGSTRFNLGANNWAVPSGVKQIRVTAVGGGGASNMDTLNGWGYYNHIRVTYGKPASIVTQVHNVTPGQVIPFSIGGSGQITTFGHSNGASGFTMITANAGGTGTDEYATDRYGNYLPNFVSYPGMNYASNVRPKPTVNLSNKYPLDPARNGYTFSGWSSPSGGVGTLTRTVPSCGNSAKVFRKNPGVGWGAAAGIPGWFWKDGGCYDAGTGLSSPKGAPGAIHIRFAQVQYMRPDGSKYVAPVGQ